MSETEVAVYGLTGAQWFLVFISLAAAWVVVNWGANKDE